VLRAVGKVLFEPGKMLDLGCGNGLLLERLKAQHSFLEPYGIEMDDGRYWKAVERIGKDQVFSGDIFSARNFLPHMYQLVLISVNRFREVQPEKAETLIKHLRACTKYLVVYSYGEWDFAGDNLLASNFDYVWQEHDMSAEVKILKPKS
jgi:trans-aconitate methyltransferase